MNIGISSNDSFTRAELANINDIARKAPEPKGPEPVEFAKADIKPVEGPKVEIEKPEPIKVEVKEPEVMTAAAYAVSPQGDDLTVTELGMQSSQAGGKVQAVENDGIVAKKETIEISYSTEAGEKLKEQLREIRGNQAGVIHEAVNNLEAFDKSVNERQSYMIEANAKVTLSNPDYLSEEVKHPVKKEEDDPNKIV